MLLGCIVKTGSKAGTTRILKRRVFLCARNDVSSNAFFKTYIFQPVERQTAK